MEAWLTAHAIQAVPRPTWGEGPPSAEEAPPDSLVPPPASNATLDAEPPKSQSGRRQRNAEALRTHLKELGDALGPRELDLLVAFAEFLKARRAARGFAHHHEHMLQEREQAQVVQSQSQRTRVLEPPSSSALLGSEKESGPS
jgi:hypothetical protein